MSHLREAWPLLKGSAQFFEDSLMRGSSAAGSATAPLRWGPSHSPENAYTTSNGTRFLSYDVALDLGVIAQTFRAVAAGAKALDSLGELSASDTQLVARLDPLRRRLPAGGEPRLDAMGELAEVSTRRGSTPLPHGPCACSCAADCML